MEIEVKNLQLKGMYGWSVKGADISLVIDEVMGTYSVIVLGSGRTHRDITKEEMDLLLSLFEIKHKKGEVYN